MILFIIVASTDVLCRHGYCEPTPGHVEDWNVPSATCMDKCKDLDSCISSMFSNSPDYPHCELRSDLCTSINTAVPYSNICETGTCVLTMECALIRYEVRSHCI